MNIRETRVQLGDTHKEFTLRYTIMDIEPFDEKMTRLATELDYSQKGRTDCSS